MEPFEYVSILSSIILGLGITQILTGIASMTLEYRRIHFYIPHLAWILLIFGFHLQEWWIYFEYSRVVMTWRLIDYSMIMIYPIILYIMARLLFPSFKKRNKIDMEIYYFQTYRKLFLMGFFLPVFSIPQNLFLLDLPLISQIGPVSLALLFLLGISMKRKNPAFHYIFSLVVLGGGIFYIIWVDPIL